MQWNLDFSDLQEKRKLVWGIGEFVKSKVKCNVWQRKKNGFWFELSVYREYWKFEENLDSAVSVPTLPKPNILPKARSKC